MRKGSWERKIWEDLEKLLQTDADGDVTLKVSFEDNPSDQEIDPVELQRLALQVSILTLTELKIMNLHLSHLSDQRFQLEDVGDQDLSI